MTNVNEAEGWGGGGCWRAAGVEGEIALRVSNTVSFHLPPLPARPARQQEPLSDFGESLPHISGQHLVILGFLFLNQMKKKATYASLEENVCIKSQKKPQKYKKRPPGHVTG